MPFQNAGNRAFTLVSVGRNAPPASGVYGLSNARQWLYIGSSANIRAELLSHLDAPSAFLREHSPSGFTFELCAPGEQLERQNQLISELTPVGNRLHGNQMPGPT